MGRGTKEKIAVLGLAFAFFAGGVLALSMERGAGRTLCLVLSFAGLAAVALRQTVKLKR